MVDLELSVIFVACVVLICYLYKSIKGRNEAKQQVSFTTTEKAGWCHLDLDQLVEQEEIKQILFHLETNPDKWDKRFSSEIIEMIHFRDRINVLKVATQLHSDKKLTESVKTRLRLILTTSSILFNFRLPKTLWLVNKETIFYVCHYLVYTRSLTIQDCLAYYKNEMLGKEYMTYTKVELDQYKQYLEHLPIIHKYIARIGHDHKSPNIHYYKRLIAKQHLFLWDLLDRDETNLCKLLTLAYGVADLDIPNDYVLIDDFIYDYLKKENRYIRLDNHLSVVK